ncbi:MAG: amino-acid N-acetyltransferase [Chitinispirillaceae bacterium]|nr:amino-acid N-acetyltransferase [Chitinispirillaceae bacterium]
MDKNLLKEQVEVIRQAFGYINQFKGETFVIKISSELIENPFIPVLIKDLVLLHRMGIKIIIVPGARCRIDEILTRYGIECKRVKGIRISPPEAIPFIKMASFDVANKIMTILAECGANGVIGNWVKARGIGVRDGIDYQSSGMVERLQVDIVKNILEQGLIPIFPNIGWSGSGRPYNISSNELAYTISINLIAAKLFFLTNGNYMIANEYSVPNGAVISEDGTIAQLTVDMTEKFIELNKNKKEDKGIELVKLACLACKGGVKRVHILNGSAEGMILKEIFSNRGLGTMIYSNQHENIRQMVTADIPEVLRLMQPSIEEGILIPRTASDIEEKIDDFCVYEVDGIIHGCGALHIYEKKQGEIAALVVDETYKNAGIGKKIVSYLIEKALKLKLKMVFLLTTQTADWFIEMGFIKAELSELPLEKQKNYNPQRNSIILKLPLTYKNLKPIIGVD